MLKLTLPVILFAAVFSMAFVTASPAEATCRAAIQECDDFGVDCMRCTATDGNGNEYTGEVCASSWTPTQRKAEARRRALQECQNNQNLGTPIRPGNNTLYRNMQ